MYHLWKCATMSCVTSIYACMHKNTPYVVELLKKSLKIKPHHALHNIFSCSTCYLTVRMQSSREQGSVLTSHHCPLWDLHSTLLHPINLLTACIQRGRVLHIRSCLHIKLRLTALPPTKFCELGVVYYLTLPKLWCAENPGLYIHIIVFSSVIKVVKYYLNKQKMEGKARQGLHSSLQLNLTVTTSCECFTFTISHHRWFISTLIVYFTYSDSYLWPFISATQTETYKEHCRFLQVILTVTHILSGSVLSKFKSLQVSGEVNVGHLHWLGK